MQLPPARHYLTILRDAALGAFLAALAIAGLTMPAHAADVYTCNATADSNWVPSADGSQNSITSATSGNVYAVGVKIRCTSGFSLADGDGNLMGYQLGGAGADFNLSDGAQTINANTDTFLWLRRGDHSTVAAPLTTILRTSTGTLINNPDHGCVIRYSGTDQCNGQRENHATQDMIFRLVDQSQTTTPTISNVADDADLLTAVITWDTDILSDSEVQWGPTASYGDTLGDTGLDTAHSETLTGLTQSTTYHYKVCSSTDAGQTCSADGTFTTGGTDFLGSPDAFFYDPPDGRTFGPAILDAYTFRVSSNVDSNVYPSESLIFDYQVRDSTATTVLYDNPALPLLTDNTYICGTPGDCSVSYYAASFRIPYHMAGGTYKLRVRAKTVSGGTYGAWSDDLTVTVQGAHPTCDFWGSTSSDGLSCLWGWLEWAFAAPAGDFASSAINGLLLRIETRWPLAYVFDVINAVTTGLSDTTPSCPIPSVSDTTLADGTVIPGFNFCSIINTASDLLDADADIQTWGSRIVWLIGVIALVLVGWRFFA